MYLMRGVPPLTNFELGILEFFVYILRTKAEVIGLAYYFTRNLLYVHWRVTVRRKHQMSLLFSLPIDSNTTEGYNVKLLFPFDNCTVKSTA